MEFVGNHHRDEEEEDEEEEEGSEEMLMMNNNNNNNICGTNPNNHHNINNISSLNRVKMVEAGLSHVQIHQQIINPTPAAAAAAASISSSTTKPKYRECLRNHAINVMGHALDGCGEFMPGGPEGSVEALKCAACSCHRNFHRKENPTDHHNHHHTAHLHHRHQESGGGPFGSYYRTCSTTNTTAPSSGYLHLGPPPHQLRPLALPSVSGGGGGEEEEEYVSDPADGGGHHNGSSMNAMMMRRRNGGDQGSCKKRFRTKFTAEQKERMLGMAERIGWRIQKCDEDLVQQLCHETNVKRHVFKVWMHNNKHTLGKSSITTTPTSSNLNINNNSSSCNTSRQAAAAAHELIDGDDHPIIVFSRPLAS